MDAAPLWEQVAQRLRRRLAGGAWEGGQLLPGERRLAADLGVARVTLRRALAALAAEGLLGPRQGRGTRALGPAPGAAAVVHLVFEGPHARPLHADRYLGGLLGHLALLGPAETGGVRLVLVPPGGDHLAALQRIGYPRACRAGGLLLAGLQTPPPALFARLRRDRVPHVLLGQPHDGQVVAHVQHDHRAGGRMAARALIAAGHRRLGLIDGPWSHAAAQARREGVEAAGREAGVPVLPAEIRRWQTDEARAALRRLLDGPEPIDALLVAGREAIVGALAVLRSRPGDLAGCPLMTLGSTPEISPGRGLSVCVAPLDALAQAAVATLARMRAGHPPAAAPVLVPYALEIA